MKVKHLKKGEFRVIQVDEEAIFELLCETMIDRANNLFGILDVTKVHFKMSWDKENNEFICAICDSEYAKGKEKFDQIDLEKMSEEVGVTTHTLYGRNCYVTWTDQDAFAGEKEE